MKVNRIRTFSTADVLSFRSVLPFAKAAEWAHGRSGPPWFNAERKSWYYGNVDDGGVVETRVTEP